jgi:hypothetical protein
MASLLLMLLLSMLLLVSVDAGVDRTDTGVDGVDVAASVGRC